MHHTYLKRIVTSIAIAVCALAASAIPQARVRTFNIHDGMPSNYVTNIVQDSRDRVWIATWNGLSFYDGYRFVNFHDRTGGMTSNRIIELVSTSDGILWVLPYERHPYLLNPGTGEFTALSSLTGSELNLRAMTSRSDTLWIKTDTDYLSVTGAKSGRPTIRKHPATHWPGTPYDRIARTYTDSRGRAWQIAADGTISLKDVGETGYHTVDIDKTPDRTTICARALWLEDPYGNVWLGGREGPFGYYDETRHIIVPYPIPSRLHNNAPIPRIEVALVDRQNNLWISSMHNLTLVRFNNSNLHEVGAPGQSDTRSVAVAPDGTVWMGCTDGTLCRYSQDGTFAGYLSGAETGRLSSSMSPTRFAERIYALFADSQGTMWIGTKGKGIYTVEPDGSICHYTAADGPGALPHDNIYDIDQDPAGNVWIATFGEGVALLRSIDNQPGARQFYSPGHGLDGYPPEQFRHVRRITHTPAGVVAASTTDGLLTFDSRHSAPAAIRFYTTTHTDGRADALRSNHLMHTLATSDGSLYLAPLGEIVQKAAGTNLLTDNLSLTDIRQGEAPHPLLHDHSPAGNILSMVEGTDGMMYLVFESCVLAYSPTSGSCHSIGYDDFDGLIEFTEAKAVCHPRTGCIWVPSARGCVVIDPAKTSVTKSNPRISVCVITDADAPAYVVDPQRVELPVGVGNVSFSMAALDYSTHELIRYAYSLDEGDWVYVGDNGTVSLSGLSPGNHRLRVRATDANGQWIDGDSDIEIYATPTFWQSYIGQALILIILVLIAGGLLYLLYVWQKRPIANMLAKKKILQESVIAQISANQTEPDTQESAHSLSKGDRRLLHQLNEYIDSHLSDESLRIDDIADAMQMSRTLLYSRIKQLTGMSPSDLLKHLRMERARHLISETDMTFSEIAYAVGYADPKYFAKCFKRDTGLTPTEYRASNTQRQ